MSFVFRWVCQWTVMAKHKNHVDEAMSIYVIAFRG